MRCGSQNGLSEGLEGCHTLYGSENGLSETTTGIADVKTDSTIFYDAATCTRFAENKTNYPKLYKAATRFVEVKAESSKPYRADTGFADIKTHILKL